MMSPHRHGGGDEPVLRAAPPYVSRATSVTEAIARGACNTAREIGAKFIVAFTESGSSAMTVSLARPSVPIIAYSPNAKTRRRMALYWASCRARCRPSTTPTSSPTGAPGTCWRPGFGVPGERVVIVFGAPIGVSGSTNSIRVHVLG